MPNRQLASPFGHAFAVVFMAITFNALLTPWLTIDIATLAATVTLAITLAAGAVGLRYRSTGTARFGWADRITLGRLAIVALLGGQLAAPVATGVAPAALALLALALDGLDGWLARRLGEASPAGARLDMETDAVLILMLCALVWQSGRAGVWILAIGALRYAFSVAQYLVPRLAAALPPSNRRRAVCAVQGAVLAICLLPGITDAVVVLLAATALALLCYSFAMDIHWLIRKGANNQPTE